MRQIRFRGWDRLYKKMIEEVDSIDFLKGFVYYMKDEQVEREPLKNCELLQFTGLQDKNGKDIYEGDIIEWYYGSEKEKTFDSIFKAKVVWKEHTEYNGSERYESHHVGFVCKWLTKEQSEEMQYTDLPNPKEISVEVIGNIYEKVKK